MTFLGTANVTFPVWLQLNSQFDNDGTETVVAAYSQDHTHWQTVGAPLKWSSKQFFLAGAVVTSHDTTQTATAHFTGLSLLSNDWSADDIGDTGLVGNASTDLFNALDGRTTVEAAGSDVWGTSDSFYFIHRGEVPLSQPDSVTTRVAALQATDAFAKAGVMYRDGLAADAASVILDVKPDGGIEFMARMCAGCPTTFIAGTSVEFPVWLRLDLRDDGSIAASLRVGDLDWEDFGSVSVPMTTPVPGFAATSHNPGQLATAVFDTPAFEFPLPTD
jgi:hypothetical protein